jgi:sterol 3beta-glucosyltransferase
MCYILHHGGAGTTGAAAAAGVPNTAVPFSADQAFWARLIHRLGVGPASPPATRLSRERMDNILIDALSNPAYRRSAETIAQGIRQEDGVALALRVIQAQLGLERGQV